VHFLAVKKGSKILGRSPGSMPLPVSLTHYDACGVTVNRCCDFCLDGELAAVRHGGDGVEIEIEQHLLQLLGVDVNLRQLDIEALIQLDFMLVQMVFDQCEGFLDALAHVGPGRLRAPRSGELEQLLNNFSDNGRFLVR